MVGELVDRADIAPRQTLRPSVGDNDSLDRGPEALCLDKVVSRTRLHRQLGLIEPCPEIGDHLQPVDRFTRPTAQRVKKVE